MLRTKRRKLALAAATVCVIMGRRWGVRSRLFGVAEPGAWYDPSDLNTYAAMGAELASMYQDYTGTTPVTAVEQPVGFLMDLRYGKARGAELVTNGDGSTVAGWSAGVGSALSVVGGAIKATNAAGTDGAYFGQNLGAFTAGQTIEVFFDCISDGTSRTARAYLGTALGTSDIAAPIGLAFGARRRFLHTFTANTAVCWLWFYTDALAVPNYILVDNVSAKPIPGNHARQSVSASRPVVSARYNLLTSTEDLTSWSGANKSVSAGVADPNGGTTAFTVTATGAVAEIYKSAAVVSGSPALTSVWVRRRTGTGTVSIRNAANSAWIPLTITASWSRVTNDGGAAGATAYLDMLIATSGDAIDLWHPDLRLTADANLSIPPYQRVNTATDYDTAGFPLYLLGDGIDDNLAASCDLTGTDKLTVWASMTKLSDAAAAIVAELTSSIAVNNGAFAIFAPDGAAPRFTFSSKGTGTASAQAAGYAAPITSVLTGIGDIAGDIATLRVNGIQAATSAVDQGAGNYSSATLNLFMRNSATLPLNGRLFQFIARGAKTGAADIARAERFVAGKAGVTL